MNIAKAIKKLSLLIGTKKIVVLSSKVTGSLSISPTANAVHVIVDSDLSLQGIALIMPNDDEMPIGKMLVVSFDNSTYNTPQNIAIQQITEVESALVIPLNIRMQEPKGYSTFIWLGSNVGWEIHGLSILKTFGDSSQQTPLPDEEGGPPNP